MTPDDFAAEVIAALPYRPNEQQVAVVGALARFCDPAPRAAESVFILNGYAGTGKTSLTGALVRVLEAQRRPVMLLAPTGRPPRCSVLTLRDTRHTLSTAKYTAIIRSEAPGCTPHLCRPTTTARIQYI